MPIYALDDVTPTLPAEGRYWVAPDAHVIGRVVIPAATAALGVAGGVVLGRRQALLRIVERGLRRGHLRLRHD